MKEITYDEYVKLFDSFGTGLVYIGGKWCYHCENVKDIVLDLAKKHNVEVYNYDPVFKNIYGEMEDLRDCKSLEIKLKYYAIVEKSGFKSKELVKDTLIPRIHVPFYMAIKNGSCVGYYTIELEKTGDSLHLHGETLDRTEEFKNAIDELLSKLELDDKFKI